MEKLSAPIQLQTAFGDYRLDWNIGEGGAGTVYGGEDDSGNQIAVKVLTKNATDKRKRFKNETGFLARNTHKNIVSVIDTGMATDRRLKGPFYVMKRYTSSLRAQMATGQDPQIYMSLFSQMLDGVEAAHLLGAVHRDLKPENFLYDAAEKRLAVADFGIALFNIADLLTPVDDKDKRLANFMYAAPEQRRPGATIDKRADIYALGLILNEFFTGHVPHGTNYQTIGSVAPEFAFLDEVVTVMTSQSADSRPLSVAHVKELLLSRKDLALSRQKLDELNKSVVYEGDVTDPLAFETPSIIAAEWENGVLRLTLDHQLNDDWAYSLLAMGSFRSVMGVGPETFQIAGNVVRTNVMEDGAQDVINYFKEWLPVVTRTLHNRLTHEAAKRAQDERQRLNRERQREEARIKVNSSLKF